MVAYFFCLPKQLFDVPASMVLLDRQGRLLGARIAADGQWRFPEIDSVPVKFEKALLEFEDRRFYKHPGIDPIGIGRAVFQNIQAKRIVSGGSTLSMQLVRMSRHGKARSFFQKFIEMILATRLELRYSKKEILAFYASHAPFGGNVVGLDAASWRYFGKDAHKLSWAEAATLAVLPNSPALIHPGRNREALLQKRNKLLDRLHQEGHLDGLGCELAKEEPLPNQPLALPQFAPHLLHRAEAWLAANTPNKKSLLQSSIDLPLQQLINDILQKHAMQLQASGIHNMAALVLDVESGAALAYAGNVTGSGFDHGENVDIIPAPRSTGSILKPFLYALTQQDGNLLPNSLVADVPMQIGGFKPENFHNAYDGLVSARKALVRSLNIPMVRMLQDYSIEKFHYHLQKLGFHHITKPPDHYGLPLILGGAEASLWDLCSAYSGMSRTLNHFYPLSGRYLNSDFREASFIYQPDKVNKNTSGQLIEPPILSASAIWLTFESMLQLERPGSSGEWERFGSSKQIAWKTGTSFGFRDAWAIGVTPRFVVGVWAGNADGEGRPGLTGVSSAAPAMFDIFKLLPEASWFEQPFDEMVEIPVCKKSGFRASAYCEADSIWICETGLNSQACPYHRLVHLDASGQWQVNSNCALPSTIQHQSHFVLPPVEEHFYRLHDPTYKSLPPFHSDCTDQGANNDLASLEFIYPKNVNRIYVPVDLDGKLGSTVFKVAHREPGIRLHWHLDETFLGSTREFHHLELQPSEGWHTITVVDEAGNSIAKRVEFVMKKNVVAQQH